MPMESREPSPDRRQRDLVRFQQTPLMPTYLLAMAVGHLRAVSQISGTAWQIDLYRVLLV